MPAPLTPGLLLAWTGEPRLFLLPEDASRARLALLAEPDRLGSRKPACLPLTGNSVSPVSLNMSTGRV